MKKRLMSAALALAMVLTLLPATMLTAFAEVQVTTGNPDTVSKPNSTLVGGHFAGYTTSGTYSSVTVTYQAADDNATGKERGKWYWTDTVTSQGDTIYRAVSGGIVSGTGTSGTWYPDLDAMTKTDADGNASLTSTSFTLLANADLSSVLVDSNTKAPTSLNIDVNGYDLTLPSTLPAKFSSLTITNRLNPLSYGGSVSAIAKDTEARTSPAPTGISYSNLTVTVSNTTVASVDLTGGTNTVTLNNVTVTGGVTMDGHSETTTTSTGAKTQAYGNQTLNVNNNGTNNLSTSTSFGGAIAISNAASATVNLNNATGGQSVTVNSNGGTVNVNGASVLGAVTVGTRAGDYAPAILTINGGTVGAITRTDGDNKSTKASTVTVNSATAASLVMKNATVKVNQGKVTGALTVQSGSLTLTGPVTTGDITLANEGKTTLSITGDGSKIGDITVAANKGGNLTISSWPTGRLNTFGKLDLDTGYKARGVKGGTFTDDTGMDDPANAYWFDTDLQYVVNVAGGNVALYGKKELATAISDIGSTTAGNAAEMHILCQDDTYTLNLVNSGLTWAKIGYQQPTGMILPEMVNSYSISTWTSGDNTSSVPAGKEEVIPLSTEANKEFTLYANGVATTVVKSITKAAVSGNTVENQDVRVTMNGTNIQISGAVTPAPGSNIATILLNLTTDALQTSSSDNTAGGGSTPGSAGYITLEDVQVFYNVDNKTVEFSKLQKLNGGAIVNANGELVLNNGTGTHYTVSASLVQSASSLGIYLGGKEIQATVSGTLANRTQTAKDQIIAQIAGTGAEFDINGNRAILEAINAAQATITSDSTVSGWVTTAQNYVWRNGNSYRNATTGQLLTVGKGDGSINPHTGTMSTTGPFGTDATTIAGMYSNAYIVPYLVVNATGMNDTGTLNATLTVYYRVDVSGNPYSPTEYYTVKAGVPLGALTGDMATNPVKVNFATAFPYATATQMHQDGKYVYQKNATHYNGVGANANVTAQYAGWLINHAGSGNGSLGTIVLNSTAGPITLGTDIVNRAPGLIGGVTYDDLQAAIDDTVPGLVSSTGSVSTETMDTVTIGGTYAPTECTINMTGIARKVKVISNGNRKITKGNNNVDVQTLDGINFIVQLAQDNVPVGTVAIGVSGTVAGTASVSATSAKAGQTVTVTVIPNAGQTTSGVTVKTNTGAAVNATSTGKVNEYSFTVPTGATSITVTPNFTGSTMATFAVSTNTVQGTAQAITGTTDNKAAQGTTVPVTVYPNSGYRTMGLTARGNNGATATVSRTGNNSFNVTVPSGATTVTLTPSFDIDNKTPFTDVPASYWASSDISWIYNKGYTTGYGSAYTFAPTVQCTRWEMVTFLWKAAGYPQVNIANPFKDVTSTYPNAQAYQAILWAASKNLIDTSSGYFYPTSKISRADTVEILYKQAGSPTASTRSGFKDVATTASYAKAVSWAEQKGITNGKDNRDTFKPNDTITRQEIAKMLHVAFG